MKKYSITAEIRVKNDLAEAKHFFNSRRRGLGLHFISDYRNSISKLKINPMYEVRYDDIRCLPFETFRFMIHFKVDEINNSVLILGVISTHTDPSTNWL